MPDTVHLIPATSPDWDARLRDVPHDFHHTAAHHLVWQQDGAGDAWLAVYGSGNRSVVWPHLLRRIPGHDLYDITDVDGYCGPLAAGCSRGDPFLRDASEAIFEHWRSAGVVSVFTRFHPLLMNQFCFARPAFAGEDDRCPAVPGLRHEGHTVSIDLALSDAEARRAYRKCHARQIRRTLEDGLSIARDNSGSSFREFVHLYYQTMERNDASAHYFFSTSFLDRLRAALGSGLSIHQARIHGRTVASVMITEFSGIVQYLLGAVHNDFCHLSPLKPLLDSVRQWAHQRGNRIFHLGGGRRCDDSDPLFFFKSGFSRHRHCFYTGRWVLDRARYLNLTREHLGSRDSSFFPAYRAPLAVRRAAQTAEV